MDRSALALLGVFSPNVEIGEEVMFQFNAPLVQPELAREIGPGVIWGPDPHINLVPNIGIGEIGTDAVLVIDCGLGRENGKRVFQKAVEVARGKTLLLTTTHFHPEEHAFGAQDRSSPVAGQCHQEFPMPKRSKSSQFTTSLTARSISHADRYSLAAL